MNFTILPEDNQGLDLSDPMEIFRAGCQKLFDGCKDKEVTDLTEAERFAVAFFAGVNWDWTGDGQMTSITTERCAITKIDGKFLVAVQTRRETRGCKINVSPS